METQREGKKQYSLSLLIRISLAVVVVISVILFATNMLRYNELLKEKQALEEQKQELNESREELQAIEEGAEDENSIIRIARKVWNLFFPDEVVYYNEWNGD